MAFKFQHLTFCCCQALPQGSQRVDEVPTVQTKAKLNHGLSRGSASDFGMESMFEKSRFESFTELFFD
jgi:hypothetical protein